MGSVIQKHKVARGRKPGQQARVAAKRARFVLYAFLAALAVGVALQHGAEYLPILQKLGPGMAWYTFD